MSEQLSEQLSLSEGKFSPTAQELESMASTLSQSPTQLNDALKGYVQEAWSRLPPEHVVGAKFNFICRDKEVGEIVSLYDGERAIAIRIPLNARRLYLGMTMKGTDWRICGIHGRSNPTKTSFWFRSPNDRDAPHADMIMMKHGARHELGHAVDAVPDLTAQLPPALADALDRDAVTGLRIHYQPLGRMFKAFAVDLEIDATWEPAPGLALVHPTLAISVLNPASRTGRLVSRRLSAVVRLGALDLPVRVVSEAGAHTLEIEADDIPVPRLADLVALVGPAVEGWSATRCSPARAPSPPPSAACAPPPRSRRPSACARATSRSPANHR